MKGRQFCAFVVSLCVTVCHSAVIEDYTPFGRSTLWKLLKSYYESQGIDAFATNEVPSYITSNAYIGRDYAKLVQSVLLESQLGNSDLQFNPKHPVYIVEVGTGHGKFSFNFLTELINSQRATPFPLDNVKYVMTDVTNSTFEFLRHHPQLQKFYDLGILDYASFDSAIDTELRLQRSGETISVGTMSNPVIVIANYVVGQLPADAFIVEDGILKEAHVKIQTAENTTADANDPSLISTMETSWRHVPINNVDTHYSGASAEGNLATLLKWYVNFFSDEEHKEHGGHFLIPYGAIGLLEKLRAMSTKGLILLTADKGESNPEMFSGVSEPYIAVHGSWSILANYHALGLFFVHNGGCVLQNSQGGGLETNVMLLPLTGASPTPWSLEKLGQEVTINDDRLIDHPYIQATYNTQVTQFSSTDFFHLLGYLGEKDHEDLTIETIVSFLKLANYDPYAFSLFGEKILEQLPNATMHDLENVVALLPHVTEALYVMDGDVHTHELIASVYDDLGYTQKALEILEQAVHDLDVLGYPEDAILYTNLASAHYNLGQVEEARTYAELALKIDPKHADALAIREHAKKFDFDADHLSFSADAHESAENDLLHGSASFEL